MIFCFHIVTAVLGHGRVAFKHTSAVCWILTFLKVFPSKEETLVHQWDVLQLNSVTSVHMRPPCCYFPLVFILPLICGYSDGRLNSFILCLLQWRLCNHMWLTVVVPVAQTPVKHDIGCFRGSRFVSLLTTVLWIHMLKGPTCREDDFLVIPNSSNTVFVGRVCRHPKASILVELGIITNWPLFKKILSTFCN